MMSDFQAGQGQRAPPRVVSRGHITDQTLDTRQGALHSTAA